MSLMHTLINTAMKQFHVSIYNNGNQINNARAFVRACRLACVRAGVCVCVCVFVKKHDNFKNRKDKLLLFIDYCLYDII